MSTAADDPVLVALEELVAVGHEQTSAWRLVTERVEEIQLLRGGGIPYSQMNLIEGTPVLTGVLALQDRLDAVVGRLRRTVAHQLRAEGLSTTAIGKLFGVSRQRAAQLLDSDESHLG